MNHDFLLVVCSFGVGIAFWPVRRLFSPWKCACGHRHWFASRMMRHIALKHALKER